MSPVERLKWLAALAVVDGVPACALRAAMVLAEHASSEDGRARPGLNKALGANAALRGPAWLISHGWIAAVEIRPGKPNVYKPMTPPSAVRDPSTVMDLSGMRDPSALMQTPISGEGTPPSGLMDHKPGRNQVNEPGSVASVSFPLKSGARWSPPPDLLTKLAKARPELNADEEIRRAALWCEMNSMRRKTAAGMPRFLAGWFNRATAGTATAGNDGPLEPSMDELRELAMSTRWQP